VVCIHGIGGHGLRFRRLAEERLAARHRVVAVDLRGCGHSTWEPPWSFAQHVDDLLATFSALGLDRPSLVGHSFGGRLVLELEARAPEHIGRGVLLDPAVWVPPPIALARAEEARLDRSFATLDEARAEWRRMTPDAPLDAVDEDLRQHLFVGADGRLRPRRLASTVVTGFSELATPPPLEQLRRRLLVVRGAGSEVVPDALVDALLADFRDVFEIVTVAGGHNVLWEAFDETADAVEAFLNA
jgi:lipase